MAYPGDFEALRERTRFMRELEALGLALEREGPVPAPGVAPVAAKPVANPTLGFEFDLNYGLDFGLFNALKGQMPPGSTYPVENTELTKHLKRKPDKSLADGFSVTLDGPRLEIGSAPFEIANEAEFKQMAANIVAFGKELNDTRKKTDRSLMIPGVRGHPTHFTHGRTVIDKLPLCIAAAGDANSLAFPPNQGLWASPQATAVLPLGKVADLIVAIVRTRETPGAVPLTGPATARLGLRSDLAVTARRRVLAHRKKAIGTMLLDGTNISAEDYSPALTGMVILVVIYLLTSVIVDPRDDRKESYAKGRLPINLKTPFWQVYKNCLTNRERAIFRQLYANTSVRGTLWKLADPNAGTSAGSNRLFPPKTHWDLDRFHSTPFKWDDLVDHICGDAPLIVTKANTVPKPHHALGDEILVAPLSSKIDFARTTPLIAIELRRIGFVPMPLRLWNKFMVQVFGMARKLNS